MTTKKIAEEHKPSKGKLVIPEFTSAIDFKAWLITLTPEERKSEAVAIAARDLIEKLQKS